MTKTFLNRYYSKISYRYPDLNRFFQGFSRELNFISKFQNMLLHTFNTDTLLEQHCVVY